MGTHARRRDAPVRAVGTTTGRPAAPGPIAGARRNGLKGGAWLLRQPGVRKHPGSGEAGRPKQPGSGVFQDAAAGAGRAPFIETTRTAFRQAPATPSSHDEGNETRRIITPARDTRAETGRCVSMESPRQGHPSPSLVFAAHRWRAPILPCGTAEGGGGGTNPRPLHRRLRRRPPGRNPRAVTAAMVPRRNPLPTINVML